MQPLISIILPTYNGAQFIERAVWSVREQNYVSWELIVIDDGSADGTARIISKMAEDEPRIRIIRNEKNLGIQHSLNKGLAAARGEYVARIDDDDVWLDRDKLALQMAYLAENPDCALVGTGAVVVDEKEKELFRYFLPKTDADIRASMLFKNCFVHSSVMFGREKALASGGYGEGEDVKHVEDYDLWLRLGLLGTLGNLPIYGVEFTMRPGSLSSANKQDQFEKNIALVRKYGKKYPNYHQAMLFGYFRHAANSVKFLVPEKLTNAFIGWYKKNW